MLDLWTVGIYLAITLVVGIALGRNVKDLSAFSIADKNYGTAVLIATITATFLGGGDTLGGGEKAFKYGTIFFIFVISNLIYSMIIANVLAPRIDKYKGCISVADIIRVMFGKKAQIVAGIAGSLKETTIIGAQLSAIGYVFHYFLGLSHSTGIFIAGGIVVLYSVFGGMKSVTVTDVIQFIVLVVAIPMIANVGLHKIGGYQKLFHLLPASHLKILPENKLDFIQNIDTALVIMLTVVGPTSVQRLLMAKDAKQAAKAFRYSGCIYFVALSMIALIGFVAKILAPNLNPHMAVPYVVDLLPLGFRGLAIAGLLAIIMSTADSLLNAVSVLLINDVVTPLSKNQITETRKLQLARLSTFVIGLLSIIGAVSFESVLDIMMFGHVFWSPLIVAPFFVVTVGFQLNKNSFWYSAIGAIATVILWEALKLEGITGFSSTLPGMVASAILLFSSHYYYKKYQPAKFEPIIFAKDIENSAKKKSLLSNLSGKKVKQFLLGVFKYFKFSKFSEMRVSDFGAPYQVFACFAILNYIVPLFTWVTKGHYFDTLAVLRIISGILCVGLLFAAELNKKYNKLFPLYWHFTLMVCLPITATVMIILNSADIHWLFNATLSIFLLALLVDWLSFIIILVLGAVIGYLITKTFYPTIIHISEENIYLALYTLGFSIAIGVLFARRREDFIRTKLATLKALGGSIAHELRTPVAALHMFSTGSITLNNKLYENYKVAKEQNLPIKDLTTREIKALNSLSEDVNHVTAEAMLIIDMLLTKLKDPARESNKDYYSIQKIVESSIKSYPLNENQRALINLKLQDNFMFYGNSTLVTHIIFNLLKNALYYINVAGKGDITITTKATPASNNLYFRDTSKGIPTELLPRMFEKFISTSNGGTGLGLSFCKTTMEDLGGNIKCKSVYGEFTEFILEFPRIKSY
jgi:Na+/proline symporter/signal transduction histidine kinase